MKVYDQLSKRDKIIFHLSIWIFIIVFSLLFDENSETAGNTIVAFLMTGLFTLEMVFVIRYFIKKSKNKKQVHSTEKNYSYENEQHVNRREEKKVFDFSHYGDPTVANGKWIRKFRYKRDFKLPDNLNVTNIEYQIHYEIKDDKVFFIANPDKDNEFIFEVTDPEVAASIKEYANVEDIDIHIGFINANIENKFAKIKIAFYRSIDIENSEYVTSIDAKLVNVDKFDDETYRQDRINYLKVGDVLYLKEDEEYKTGFGVTDQQGYTVGELAKRTVIKIEEYVDSQVCIAKVKEVMNEENGLSTIITTLNFIDPRFDR